MSDWLLYFGIFIAVFFTMEGVAWFLHKYVMHRFLWVLHKSHHEPRKGIWELNDAFGIFFIAISMALFEWSVQLGGPRWALFVALGITAYGFVYFLAHDVLVHHRVNIGLNPGRDICGASIRLTDFITPSMGRTAAFLSGLCSPVRRTTSSGSSRNSRPCESSSTAGLTQSARCTRTDPL